MTLDAATRPPATRDGVRLLVAAPNGVTHTRFSEIGRFLDPGDLLVVNTSAAINAAVEGDGLTVHFSNRRDDGTWIVEVRPPGRATGPASGVRVGQRIALPDGVGLTLIEQLPPRLWRVQVALEGDVIAYLARVGRPVRYNYVPGQWPLSDYQTVFARDPGSAEMPSASRPFTDRIVVDLVTRGVAIAPITLHCGVSSAEPGEPPQSEWFRVPEATARLVNDTRRAGGRIVAAGTTVTRALESAAAPDGTVRAAEGWTDLVVTPQRPPRVVRGLITGWHEEGASHLQLLDAVAGTQTVGRAYKEAERMRYLAHEFGDSCLLLA